MPRRRYLRHELAGAINLPPPKKGMAMLPYPETSKVLSIQSPYCYLLLYPQICTSRGLIPKTLENRYKDITQTDDCPRGYRGHVFIHTGLNPSPDFYNERTGGWYANANITQKMKANLPPNYAAWAKLMSEQFGGIVGCAEIVGVTTWSGDPWYVPGQVGILLAKPQPLPFFRCPGKPYLFDIGVAPIFEHLRGHCCCCSLPDSFCNCSGQSCPGCGNCRMDCMCKLFEKVV